MAKKRIHITTGCPLGIGPEVVQKALKAKEPEYREIEFTVHTTKEGDYAHARVISYEGSALERQAKALDALIEAAQNNVCDAIVTGPIQKACLALVKDGPFAGQTELCHAHLAKDQEPPLMCFAGGPFALGLLTVHLPLAKVAQSIDRELLRAKILRLHDFAKKLSGKSNPKLVVLALNPHAGEGGLLGDEEERIYKPVIEHMQNEGLDIWGPTPADGFFAHRRHFDSVDAVLASAHDQGLAPYKLLSNEAGVNITWGLRVLRTSPDHGTANDIVGKNIASSASMTNAILLAHRLTN